jgi:acetyltransferase
MRSLLHPERIAIVGATPKAGFATSILTGLVRCGYEGTIHPVTPRYEEVHGRRAYPTLSAIPGGADLAIVVVPNHLVPEVLDDCARAGVGAVNIISSGFGEQQEDASGAARQAAIGTFARRTGIRVVGPNCLGNISVPAQMTASSGPYPVLRRGGIALALQSGLIAYSIILPANDRGMGFSYIVTLGNEADVDVADMIRHYADDEETRVIGCFVEQFRTPEKFLAAAELAVARQKPIVMLKIGRSEAGRRTALAHTGSLVGSDGIADAVMRQYGITRVHNLDQMAETLAIFHTKKLPRGRGVASAFVSGGAAGLTADLGADCGLDFPTLAPQTAERLGAIIPAFGTVGNPLDYTGQAAQQPEILEGSLAALAEDPNIHTIIYGRAFPSRMDRADASGQVIWRMPEQYPDKVFLVMSLVAGEMKASASPTLTPADPTTELDGIPFLQGTENSLKAVAALIDYAEFQRQRAGESRGRALVGPLAEQARALVRAAGGRPLVEREAKALLALYDIPTVRERLATTADEAVAAARAIGYPIVLKIESPDLPHKTEAGGVLLNIADDEAARAGLRANRRQRARLQAGRRHRRGAGAGDGDRRPGADPGDDARPAFRPGDRGRARRHLCRGAAGCGAGRAATDGARRARDAGATARRGDPRRERVARQGTGGYRGGRPNPRPLRATLRRSARRGRRDRHQPAAGPAARRRRAGGRLPDRAARRRRAGGARRGLAGSCRLIPRRDSVGSSASSRMCMARNERCSARWRAAGRRAWSRSPCWVTSSIAPSRPTAARGRWPAGRSSESGATTSGRSRRPAAEDGALAPETVRLLTALGEQIIVEDVCLMHEATDWGPGRHPGPSRRAGDASGDGSGARWGADHLRGAYTPPRRPRRAWPDRSRAWRPHHRPDAALPDQPRRAGRRTIRHLGPGGGRGAVSGALSGIAGGRNAPRGRLTPPQSPPARARIVADLASVGRLRGPQAREARLYPVRSHRVRPPAHVGNVSLRRQAIPLDRGDDLLLMVAEVAEGREDPSEGEVELFRDHLRGVPPSATSRRWRAPEPAFPLRSAGRAGSPAKSRCSLPAKYRSPCIVPFAPVRNANAYSLLR